MTKPDYEIARETVERIAKETGLELDSTFVPFSQSRNAQPSGGRVEPWQSLNWKVTLKRNGREVLTTDYSQGVAYCPGNKLKMRSDQANAIAREIETGRVTKIGMGGYPYETKKRIPGPALADVLHSLTLDSDVIDYADFDEWAETYGYETDSRSAESIYRACLEHALKLRSAIGEETLNALRDAAREM